jgi:hypothetical protein
MTTFGRSYPGGWPDIDSPEANLMAPVDVAVAPDPDPESWIEIDVSAAGVFLEPTQHYVIVLEHLGEDPKLAVESVAAGEASRAMMHLPGAFEPYGLDGNFRLALQGSYFCSWTEAERWFGLSADAAFSAEPSGRVAVADLDGDGHDDVLVSGPGAHLYFGDGAGKFTPAGFDPFAGTIPASFYIFADVDNDGDRDAFAGMNVGANADGDAYSLAKGDCNDADPAVHPGAKETVNGYDDDCDGVADDGTDTSDADADLYSIADGDCDDTRDDVYPGAPELWDSRDNDCDLAVDEIFVNRILLNDGAAHFTAVEAAGVETIDPTTEAAFGDGNGDGALDLYWGNWLEHYPDFPAVQDRYVTGKGDGTFVDATEAAGLIVKPVRPCYGVTWNDYNDDGRQDIYVSNYQLSDNYLWQNQGDGTFVNVAKEAHVDHDDIPSSQPQYPGGHSYGPSFGDIDLDGDWDFFLANLSHPRTQPWADPSQLYLSSGAPDYVFTDHREQWGVIYDEGDVNSALADYDNDTDLDLVVVSVYPTHYTRLYRNDGDRFVDVTYESGTATHQAGYAVWSDVDEDGDLDLLVVTGWGPPYARLLENRVGQDHAWVDLDLEGTKSNRDALGARVTLLADGLTQMRDVQGATANLLQHSRRVHFGLGHSTSIDSVTVRWVGGATEAIKGIAPGGRYHVVEGSGKGVLEP